MKSCEAHFHSGKAGFVSSKARLSSRNCEFKARKYRYAPNKTAFRAIRGRFCGEARVDPQQAHAFRSRTV